MFSLRVEFINLIIKFHLFRCRHLKYLKPSQHSILSNWRFFSSSSLNPVEKHIDRRRKIVQFNSSAKGPRFQTQRISLGLCPRAPFDNYNEPERQESLTELPLQHLDFPAAVFVVQVDSKCRHPLVGSQTDGSKVLLQIHRICGFARTWKAADDNQPGSLFRCVHGVIIQPMTSCRMLAIFTSHFADPTDCRVPQVSDMPVFRTSGIALGKQKATFRYSSLNGKRTHMWQLANLREGFRNQIRLINAQKELRSERSFGVIRTTK